MKRVKYLILGAGISGLSFAYEKRNDNYLILEKDGGIGGLCRTFKKDGFVWDVAGHFFHFHSDDTRRYYEKLMTGRKMRIAEKHAKVFYKGRYLDAPFQYNIHQLPDEEFLECLTDLYFSGDSGNFKSFGDFIKKKYGKAISEKFLIPYNEKLYACSIDDLECDSMGDFLPKLSFDMLMHFYRGLKGKTYNDFFSYPVEGCQEVLNALYEGIDSTRVRLNERAESIDPDLKICTTNTDTYVYDYLINTIPLNHFSKLVGRDDSEFAYNQVLVFNLGFDRESLDKKISWIYFPGDEIFYRVGFYNNIAGTKRLSIYVEIGFEFNMNIEMDGMLDAVLKDLKRVGIIKGHRLIAHNHYLINPAYAHITERGKNYTERFIEEMKSNHIYMIGRYANWQYSAMDDSLEQSIDLAVKI